MRLIHGVFQTIRSLPSQAFAAAMLAATLSPAGAQPQAETAPVAPRTRAEIAYSFAPVVKKAQPPIPFSTIRSSVAFLARAAAGRAATPPNRSAPG